MLALYLDNSADSANLAAAGSAADLYISLHTAALTAASTQSTSEAAYTGYARVAVPRGTGSFSAPAGGSTSNAAAISFPACTGGSETETYFAIGTAATGTGQILVFGALTASLAVSSGITPSFAVGELTASCS